MVGHSSIPEVTYPDPGADSALLLVNVCIAEVIDYSGGPADPFDHIGKFLGTAFPLDNSWQGSQSRPPSRRQLDRQQERPHPNRVQRPHAHVFSRGHAHRHARWRLAVENLKIGDMVATADGRAVPVLWIGRQVVMKQFAGEKAQLVRIGAGILDNHSDLDVTGDHGMMMDGLVINASALANDRSVVWVPLADTPERQTVYHIETQAHDVILAKGAPSESYLDIPGRRAFNNHAEYHDLYGSERTIPEMPRPRIASQRLLPDAVRARLGIGTGVLFTPELFA